MSKKYLTGYVHRVEADGTILTGKPGDEAPDWVTNEGVLTDVAPTSVAPAAHVEAAADEPADEAGSSLAGATVKELKTIAKKHGVSQKGSKADLIAAIEAARDITADDEADAATREALEARATALGIEFDEDTTDEELALVIENAE